MEEDHKHIRTFQHGDQDAFKHLYIKYLKPLTNFLSRHLGMNNEDLVDLSQEIMLSVFKNLKGFQFKSSFTTYLFTTALNHIRNHRHSSVFQQNLKEEVENIKSPSEIYKRPTEENVLKSNLEKILQLAISNLPEPDRTVFLLRTMQSMKFSEIAQVVNTSERNTQFIKQRADQALKTFLENKGISPKDGL